MGLLAGLLERHEGDECEFLRGAVNNYVATLPESIRGAALADPAFTSKLGINPGIEVIPVAGTEFPAAGFWAAAKAALRDGHADLRTVDGRRTELRAVLGEGGSMLVLSGPDGGTVEMPDPIHELLLDDATERERVILANKVWLDLPEAKRRAKAVRLAALEDDRARLHAVIDARSNSAAWY